MPKLNNILRILDSFNQHDVEYVLVGGAAVVLYGMPRMTEDIDVVVKMDKDNLQKLRKSLHELFDDDEIDEINHDELGKYAVIRYISPDQEMIDIIGNLGEKFDFDRVKYQTKAVSGVEIRIALPESLIEMKKNTYREKDKIDIMFLKRLNP